MAETNPIVVVVNNPAPPLNQTAAALSSLFIVCSHRRRSAHENGTIVGYKKWCPGGRPATLEDLESIVEFAARLTQTAADLAAANRISLDDAVKALRSYIPLPQMVAE